MKKTFLILSASIVTLCLANGQTTPQFPNTAPGLPASSVNPGLPASAANPGLPGFDNSFGPFFTNQFGNGFGGTSLNQLLLQAQLDLTQLYPVVVSINNTFDFTTGGTSALGTNGIFGSAGITSPTVPRSSSPTTGANASTLLSGTSAANLGTSLGQDLSGIIGGRANALGSSGTAMNGGVAPAISPLGTTTATGSTLSGVTGTGATFTSTRDVLRALLLLQDDIERILPLINALNGGNPVTLNTLFTNNLGTITNNSFFTGNGTGRATGIGTTPSTTTTPGTTLTPTGR